MRINMFLRRQPNSLKDIMLIAEKDEIAFRTLIIAFSSMWSRNYLYLCCMSFFVGVSRPTAAILGPDIIRSYMINCAMHTCSQNSIIIVFRADW